MRPKSFWDSLKDWLIPPIKQGFIVGKLPLQWILDIFLLKPSLNWVKKICRMLKKVPNNVRYVKSMVIERITHRYYLKGGKHE